MADMLGHATVREIVSLQFKLIDMTEEERRALPCALFVIGRGMLNGQEAYEYIKNKLSE